MHASEIAVIRFGLGARPWDRIPADGRGWLIDQFIQWKPVLPNASALASRADIVADIAEYRGMTKQAKSQAPGDQSPPSAAPARKADRKQLNRFARQQYLAQIGVRVRSAVLSDTPFAERLVHFWANHFAVSADRLVTMGLAGLMEFEAIRPHIFGRFEDMLIAVEQHPAMLLYLDQAQSVGPNSPLGRRAAARGRKVGLNENLGREIMELHTLGVRTGYSQADVTEFSRALTGWTVAGLGRGRVARRRQADAKPGDFVFVPALHEPGTRTIIGKTYREGGEAQARAILADLARAPATARHVATKLVRHFVADSPPPDLVERLEQAYLSSDGDLPTVYRALIASPEAWLPTPAKFRDPWSWTIATLRAVNNGPGAVPPMQDRMLAGALDQLGQPVWRPGSPAGYDDLGASWAAPDALLRRVDLAGRLAAQASPTLDARALGERLFGTGLTPATAQSIARAESPQQGLALLLVSPEMLRC
ncbi:DUF1800 domain-containing protein [Stakelama sp. CBK3Z-3]|uniref:DUF1800 domain-containing protein n=1 Tax=Stakelama flava TaxID=2860338 RepID=A0ABS6XQ48_9SPHN|nr:DUF1800 domain-containing protein [Stakelama flava]MBW4332345.1 DUF1800 domain-containing protein [Stakelama flava]